MYPESCVAQNVFGFDAADLFNPFTKFKPDSFPFGSNWYYFCALHFVTAVMLNVLSDTDSETQKKHKSFIESLVFGIYVTTLGVSAKLMAVSYTKGNNIYYNIQHMSLMFIALFRMVTTTSFHLLVMQPNIQKIELMRWKGLIDLTYTSLCTVLFIVIICFSLLPTDFCPIFAVTVTLFVLRKKNNLREVFPLLNTDNVQLTFGSIKSREAS
ncbi:uncharacterized protein LOC119073197 [Bradysia coprophila]|uniref:uncharacterized protein LOC119073197 n=1 Tax=Bradysia coprophila TaxID=38358 RepID=UPI00187DC0A2|nr:uncharacterized protein LOC119073197 [Bradysia coprophila]